MKIKPENYVNIQGFMRTDLKLTGNDLLVYAIIYGNSQDGESRFSGSLQYLADWCGATKQGIQKNLRNLLEKGLIKKETKNVNGVILVAYYTTELHGIQLSCTNKDISNILLDNSSSNIQQSLFNTNKDTEVINKEDTYKEKIDRFVEEYNSTCKSLPKCAKMSSKRSKGVLNIIKKFSAEEITEVFNKLEESDFCSGRSGKWRADIDFILREDKFISVLEGKYDNKTRGCSVETISSTGPKYRVSAEEKEEMRKAVERGELEEY